MSENTSDPDRIESDLDRTRARLDSRLSELQDRLSPGQVLDDLMGYFRGSEGADFGRNLAGQREKQSAAGGADRHRPGLADGLQPASAQ